MTRDRYLALMKSYDLKLTEAEIAQGWHFCAEFDGLLVQHLTKHRDCGTHCVDAECKEVTVLESEDIAL